MPDAPPVAQPRSSVPSPQFPDGPGSRSGAVFSFVLLLYTGFLYLSLVRFSHPVLIAVQVVLLLLGLRDRHLPLLALAGGLFLFGNQPGRPHALYFADMTLYLAVSLWLWDRLRAGRGPVVRTPLTPWLILFWSVSVLSISSVARDLPAHFMWITTTHPPQGPPDPMRAIWKIHHSIAFGLHWPMRALFDATLSLLFYFYLADAWTLRRDRARLLQCLCAGLGVSMAWGLLDCRNLLPLTWFRPATPSPVYFFQGGHRLQSFFGHAGWYAQWVALVSPWLLAFCLSAGGLARPWRAASGILWALSGVVLLFTFQRGGWYAFLAGSGTSLCCVALVWLKSPATRRRGVLLSATAVCVLLLLAGGVFVAVHREGSALGWRMKSGLRVDNRSHIWSAALGLSRGHPWLGVGLGVYPTAHDEEYPRWHPNFKLDKGEAHSTYLHILAERGPFALVFFLGAVCTACFHLARAGRRAAPDSATLAWIAAGLGFLAAAAVYGVVQYLFHVRAIEITFYLLLATATAELWNRRESP